MDETLSYQGTRFAGKELCVAFTNPAGRDHGRYRVGNACLTTRERAVMPLSIVDGTVILERERLFGLPERGTRVEIELI